MAVQASPLLTGGAPVVLCGMGIDFWCLFGFLVLFGSYLLKTVLQYTVHTPVWGKYLTPTVLP